MTETELERDVVNQTLGDLSIVERFEPHRLVVSSPKRSEKIQIIKTSPRFVFYKVLYESGKSIPELDGSFTTAERALNAVRTYLENSKPTREAKSKERWGDSPVPELKTKRKRKTVSGSSIEANSDN